MVQSVKKNTNNKQILGNKVGSTYPPHNAFVFTWHMRRFRDFGISYWESFIVHDGFPRNRIQGPPWRLDRSNPHRLDPTWKIVSIFQGQVLKPRQNNNSFFFQLKNLSISGFAKKIYEFWGGTRLYTPWKINGWNPKMEVWLKWVSFLFITLAKTLEV